MSQEKDNHDDILARAKSVRQADANIAANPVKSSTKTILDKASDKAEDVTNASKGIYRGFLRPLYLAISKPLEWGAKATAWTWNHTVYKKDKEGVEKISLLRATFFSAAALTAVTGATPTYPGELVRYYTAEPVWDLGMMANTYKKENVYMYKPQELDHVNDIHAAQGCKETACDANDSLYYRIEPRFSHNIWNLFTNGNFFYTPDLVAASIPSVPSKCEVTSYSLRNRFFKYAGMYPKLLDAKCEPLTVSNQTVNFPKMEKNN